MKDGGSARSAARGRQARSPESSLDEVDRRGRPGRPSPRETIEPRVPDGRSRRARIRAPSGPRRDAVAQTGAEARDQRDAIAAVVRRAAQPSADEGDGECTPVNPAAMDRGSAPCAQASREDARDQQGEHHAGDAHRTRLGRATARRHARRARAGGTRTDSGRAARAANRIDVAMPTVPMPRAKAAGSPDREARSLVRSGPTGASGAAAARTAAARVTDAGEAGHGRTEEREQR